MLQIFRTLKLLHIIGVSSVRSTVTSLVGPRCLDLKASWPLGNEFASATTSFGRRHSLAEPFDRSLLTDVSSSRSLLRLPFSSLSLLYFSIWNKHLFWNIKPAFSFADRNRKLSRSSWSFCYLPIPNNMGNTDSKVGFHKAIEELKSKNIVSHSVEILNVSRLYIILGVTTRSLKRTTNLSGSNFGRIIISTSRTSSHWLVLRIFVGFGKNRLKTLAH